MDVEIDSGLGQADQIFVGIDAADIKMNLSASRYFSLIILERWRGYLEVNRIGGEGVTKRLSGAGGKI